VMADLSELLERVRKATGPDRDIDGHIAAALRVKKNLPDWAKNWPGEWRPTIQGSVVLMNDNGEPGPHFSSMPYTASIDAALALVERVLPKFLLGGLYDFKVHNFDGQVVDKRACAILTTDMSEPFEEDAATRPLAILAALLSALIAQKAAD